jgi:hypothetical protein
VDVNRCAARGCGRWTRAGETFCRRHRGDDDERDRESPAEAEGSGDDSFRARLTAGDYNALLGPGLRDMLRGAAADMSLQDEIGALRIAIARLLREEGDAQRLAAGLARVTDVSVRAARLRGASDAEREGLPAALLDAAAQFDAKERNEEGVRRHDNDRACGEGRAQSRRRGANQSGAGLGLRGGDAADGAESG